jgi:hypothetical protein
MEEPEFKPFSELQKYGRKTANLEKDYLRRVKEIPPPKKRKVMV